MDDFTKGYIEAALWSSNDDNDNPMDNNYDINSLSNETFVKMITDCTVFQLANKVELEQAYKLYKKDDWTAEAQAGHDFWLTRNGHGTGFWDRDLGEIGDKLTKISEKHGNFDIFIDDNMEISH